MEKNILKLPYVESKSKNFFWKLQNAKFIPFTLEYILNKIKVDLDNLCDDVSKTQNYVLEIVQMHITYQNKGIITPLKDSLIEYKFNTGGFTNVDHIKNTYKTFFSETQKNFHRFIPRFPLLDLSINLAFYKGLNMQELLSSLPDNFPKPRNSL